MIFYVEVSLKYGIEANKHLHNALSNTN